MEYFWVIGGGLLQIPIIEKLKKLDFKTIVSDQSTDCVCSDICDVFFDIDIFNVEDHIEKAKGILSRGDKIVGVLAAGIDAPITMSALNEFLGIYGVSQRTSEVVHNKAKFRKKMAQLNFPTPDFKEFGNHEYLQFSNYLNTLTPPFIIKNVDSSASRGTKIFYTRNEIVEREIFEEACLVSKSNSCLVESVWVGTEHTVETFYDVDGKFYRCFITDRAFNYESGFPIETGLTNPTKLSRSMENECYDLALEVSSALGIKVGAAKFDMICTDLGPRIIEMTTRLSGGFDCQYLVPAATGKDILSMAIYTAMGKLFSEAFNVSSKNMVAVSGSVWPGEGEIISIAGIDEASEMDFIENIFMRKRVGDIISNYNDCAQRVCIIIAAAPTYEKASQALLAAVQTIKVKTR